MLRIGSARCSSRRAATISAPCGSGSRPSRPSWALRARDRANDWRSAGEQPSTTSMRVCVGTPPGRQYLELCPGWRGWATPISIDVFIARSCSVATRHPPNALPNWSCRACGWPFGEL